MGFELFPKVESDYAVVSAVLPYGAAVQRTAAVQQKLVEAAKGVVAENGGEKLVEGIFARINGNETSVRVYLTPPDIRPVSTAELTALWRARVGSITGLESLKFESDAGGPGRGAAISVELSHRNVDILARGADSDPAKAVVLDVLAHFETQSVAVEAERLVWIVNRDEHLRDVDCHDRNRRTRIDRRLLRSCSMQRNRLGVTRTRQCEAVGSHAWQHRAAWSPTRCGHARGTATETHRRCRGTMR